MSTQIITLKANIPQEEFANLKNILGEINKALQNIVQPLTEISNLLKDSFDLSGDAFDTAFWIGLTASLAGLGATIGAAILPATALGASFGALAGPIGAVAGALIGLIVGLLIWFVDWSAVVDFFADSLKRISKDFQDLINFILILFIPLAGWIKAIVIGPVGELFSGLWELIKIRFQDEIDFITGIFTVVVQWINSDVTEPIGELFSGLWEHIRKRFQADIDFIVGVFTTFVNWIKPSITEPIGKAFTGLWENIRKRFQTGTNFIVKIFTSMVSWISSSVIQNISQRFSNLWNGILSGVRGMANGVVNGINTMVQKALVPINALIGGLNRIPGVNIPTLSFQMSAPTFATGGFPMQGQMFIAREAGPELVGTIGSRNAVVNNDQIVESVSLGVYRAVRDAMGGNNNKNNPLEVNLYLDGKQITSVVERTQRERGLSLLNPI